MKIRASVLALVAALAGCAGGAGTVPPAAPPAVVGASDAVRTPDEVIGGISSIRADVSYSTSATSSAARTPERVANQAATLDSSLLLGGSVSGHIFRGTGPMVGAVVELIPTGSRHVAYMAWSDAGGRFAFPGVGLAWYGLAVNGNVLPAGAVRLIVKP